MKQISNADYEQIKRLLFALSNIKGQSTREKENARKAKVLLKKLKRHEEKRIHKAVPGY